VQELLALQPTAVRSVRLVSKDTAMKWAGAIRVRVFDVDLLTIDLYLPDVTIETHVGPVDREIKAVSRWWTKRMAK
jgi:hypothetical protein